jgi:aspartate dehydrogenase
MTRIGLLGCGNIGRIIAKYRPATPCVAVYDRFPERAGALAESLDARACARFEDFIAMDFELLVEAASIEAVRAYAEPALRNGKDLVMLSVGALADADFRQRLVRIANERRRRIRIPSGALFGLDNLKIGRISRLDQLVMRTRKPPRSLGLEVSEPTCLFRGDASECVRRFPKNVNVAVTVSLAAGRPIQVELWADPALTRNTHEVIVDGEFGEADLRVSNLPSPDNPATSYLAALSILTLLDDLDNPLVVGT